MSSGGGWDDWVGALSDVEASEHDEEDDDDTEEEEEDVVVEVAEALSCLHMLRMELCSMRAA